MWKDIRTQINVIAALTIRDLQGLMSTYNYGFAWALLEPIMFIAVMRVLRTAFKGLTPPDMTPTTFLVIGIIPFYTYNSAITAVMKVGSKPPQILSFPRVTPIDMAVASALSDFCIYFALLNLFAISASIYEGSWPPDNPFKLVVVFISLWLLGVSLGLVVAAAARVFPPVKEFFAYYSLVNRMVGGMLFVVTMFPSIYWPWLAWNPVLHCMEMMREGWFSTYTSPIASPAYVAEWILGLLLLGLSLERFQRRIPYV